MDEIRARRSVRDLITAANLLSPTLTEKEALEIMSIAESLCYPDDWRDLGHALGRIVHGLAQSFQLVPVASSPEEWERNLDI